MRISFHLGAHCTDDGRLVRSALRSRETLVQSGISVPSPRRYRSVLRDSLNALGGAEASADVQQALLDALVDSDGVTRLALFHEGLLAVPARVVTEEGLYVNAARRLMALQNLFPDHEVEFQIALCNPATMVPTLAMRAGPGGYEQIMAGADPLRLSWLKTIRRVLAVGPELPLTLWCNEDTPLIWPEVLRAVVGYEGPEALEGDADLLAALLTPEGFEAMRTSFEETPPQTLEERHARTTGALAAHGRAEELEIEAAMPGWTAETVGRLTERYEAECAEIAALPGVNFIAP